MKLIVMLKCKNKKIVDIKRTLFTNIQKLLLLNDDDKLFYLLKGHDRCKFEECCIALVYKLQWII